MDLTVIEKDLSTLEECEDYLIDIKLGEYEQQYKNIIDNNILVGGVFYILDIHNNPKSIEWYGFIDVPREFIDNNIPSILDDNIKTGFKNIIAKLIELNILKPITAEYHYNIDIGNDMESLKICVFFPKVKDIKGVIDNYIQAIQEIANNLLYFIFNKKKEETQPKINNRFTYDESSINKIYFN